MRRRLFLVNGAKTLALCRALLLGWVVTGGATSDGLAGQKGAAQEQPRRDQGGDPLPPGAIARIGPLGQPSESVKGLAFLPDSRTVVTGSLEGRVHLWEATTGKEIRHFAGPDRGILTLDLSADGKTLALCDPRVTSWLWDVPSGRVRRKLGRALWSASLSPDGRTAAIEEEKGVVLVEAATGKEIRRLEHAASPGAFSPDGRLLAALAPGSTIGVWNVSTGQRWRRLGEPSTGMSAAHISSLAFSTDGNVLALVLCGHGETDHLALWDVLTGQQLEHFGKLRSVAVNGMAFAPDGRTLFLRVAHERQVDIRAYDLFTAQEMDRRTQMSGETGFGEGGWPQTLFLSPDGRLLASLPRRSPALVWDVSTWKGRSAANGKLTSGELAALWSDLGSDTAKAYAAMGKLLDAPSDTLRLLREKIPPVSPLEPRRVQQLLKNLDSDQFSTREAASRELAALGSQVEPALRAALQETPLLETQQRIKLLLHSSTRHVLPETLRRLRGIQVLERIGSPEARQLLQAIAGGSATAAETDAAQAALQRLTRRKGAT